MQLQRKHSRRKTGSRDLDERSVRSQMSAVQMRDTIREIAPYVAFLSRQDDGFWDIQIPVGATVDEEEIADDEHAEGGVGVYTSAFEDELEAADMARGLSSDAGRPDSIVSGHRSMRATSVSSGTTGVMSTSVVYGGSAASSSVSSTVTTSSGGAAGGSSMVRKVKDAALGLDYIPSDKPSISVTMSPRLPHLSEATPPGMLLSKIVDEANTLNRLSVGGGGGPLSSPRLGSGTRSSPRIGGPRRPSVASTVQFDQLVVAMSAIQGALAQIPLRPAKSAFSNDGDYWDRAASAAAAEGKRKSIGARSAAALSVAGMTVAESEMSYDTTAQYEFEASSVADGDSVVGGATHSSGLRQRQLSDSMHDSSKPMQLVVRGGPDDPVSSDEEDKEDDEEDPMEKSRGLLSSNLSDDISTTTVSTVTTSASAVGGAAHSKSAAEALKSNPKPSRTAAVSTALSHVSEVTDEQSVIPDDFTSTDIGSEMMSSTEYALKSNKSGKGLRSMSHKVGSKRTVIGADSSSASASFVKSHSRGGSSDVLAESSQRRPPVVLSDDEEKKSSDFDDGVSSAKHDQSIAVSDILADEMEATTPDIDDYSGKGHGQKLSMDLLREHDRTASSHSSSLPMSSGMSKKSPPSKSRTVHVAGMSVDSTSGSSKPPGIIPTKSSVSVDSSLVVEMSSAVPGLINRHSPGDSGLGVINDDSEQRSHDFHFSRSSLPMKDDSTDSRLHRAALTTSVSVSMSGGLTTPPVMSGKSSSMGSESYNEFESLKKQKIFKQMSFSVADPDSVRYSKSGRRISNPFALSGDGPEVADDDPTPGGPVRSASGSRSRGGSAKSASGSARASAHLGRQMSPVVEDESVYSSDGDDEKDETMGDEDELDEDRDDHHNQNEHNQYLQGKQPHLGTRRGSRKSSRPGSRVYKQFSEDVIRHDHRGGYSRDIEVSEDEIHSRSARQDQFMGPVVMHSSSMKKESIKMDAIMIASSGGSSGSSTSLSSVQTETTVTSAQSSNGLKLKGSHSVSKHKDRSLKRNEEDQIVIDASPEPRSVRKRGQTEADMEAVKDLPDCYKPDHYNKTVPPEYESENEEGGTVPVMDEEVATEISIGVYSQQQHSRQNSSHLVRQELQELASQVDDLKSASQGQTLWEMMTGDYSWTCNECFCASFACLCCGVLIGGLIGILLGIVVL